MEPEPIRVVVPIPVPAQFFVLGPLVSLVAACFVGFFAFVISNLVLSAAGEMRFGGPVFTYGVAVFAIAFFVAMGLVYVKCFLEPKQTRYCVYANRIEYDEGLLARHRRTLVFDQVIDVSVSEGLLQQTCGVGTVTLVTQQLMGAGDGQLSNRSIALHNLPDPHGVYDLVRSLAISKER